MKTKTVNTPSIYVGTYSKYNNGSLEGKWMDLTDYSDKDEFLQACQELHKDESDPEFMFQDYENIPEAFISESGIDENFWNYINAIKELDGDDLEAFEIWMSNDSSRDLSEDVEGLIEQFRDDYCGHFKNGLEDYAYELVQDCYFTKETPDIFIRYFDYTSFARDLELNGDVWENEGHVFRNN